MSGSARHRLVTWEKKNGYGVELVEVDLAVDRLAARGVAIGWDPVPFHLEFSLTTGPGWVTERLAVATRGDGWRRTLDLRRSGAGAWSIEASAEGEVELPAPGGDPSAFADALVELSDGELRQRLGTAARESTRQFNWDRSATEVAAFYRALAGVATRPGRAGV